MKKTILSVGVAAMVLFATSCSNDQVQNGVDNNENVAQVEELQRLQQDIKALTDSIALERTSMYCTRVTVDSDASDLEKAKPGSFLKWLKVAFSDAMGAFVGAIGGVAGAVVGGASASALAYTVEGSVSSNEDGAIGMSSKLPIDGLVVAKANVSSMDSVGYYHNSILSATPTVLVKGCSDDVFNKSIVSATNKVLYNGKSVLSERIFAEDKGLKKIKSDVVELAATKDVDEYCDKLISLNQNDVDMAKVLVAYLKGLSYADHTSSSYSTKVWNMIDTSSLSERAKTALKNGVVVGNASAKLWEIK